MVTFMVDGKLHGFPKGVMWKWWLWHFSLLPRNVFQLYMRGLCWLIGRFVTFHLKGHGIKSHSSRHVGTLGKSFTRSCLWLFSVKLRHSIRAVSLAPLSNSGLEEVL